MPTINMHRNHSLGIEGARAVVEQMAQGLRDDLQANCHWDGDKLLFDRAGASGTIEAKADSIDLDIELDMTLAMLKGTIEERINTKLDSLLG